MLTKILESLFRVVLEGPMYGCYVIFTEAMAYEKVIHNLNIFIQIPKGICLGCKVLKLINTFRWNWY